MDDFLDVYGLSLNKYGEELCGDKFKILSTEEATRIVLSDGLGSGVKANILATLTSGIIATMLKENAPLEDVIETVTGTQIG
ncbi:MAG: serine/threonine protein phosphatase, partial [Anaerolineae bacterium]|nr:serine/threonine protein phosphatase [Anaerolineae bacterium]